MKNEPVAWTDGKGNYFDKNSFFPVDDLIPLYTHLPLRELTDEEIDNTSDEILQHIDTYMGRRMFARAILKKASEK
jgi:hypothetical protein